MSVFTWKTMQPGIWHPLRTNSGRQTTLTNDQVAADACHLAVDPLERSVTAMTTSDFQGYGTVGTNVDAFFNDPPPENEQQNVMFRASGVDVPAGVTVVQATLYFVATNALNGTTMKITSYAELAATASSFPAGNDLTAFNSLTKTTAFQTETIPRPALSATGTLDVTDPVAEVLALGGWATGNDLMLLCISESLGALYECNIQSASLEILYTNSG